MPEYINKIRTASGDLPINYEALANLPTISNPNLLINSDFRNPINQRDQVKYEGMTTNGYTIDRWCMGEQDFNRTVEIVNGGIKITNPNTEYPGTFQQIFEKVLPSGDYTLSIKVTSKSGGATMSCGGSHGSTKKELSIGINTLTLTSATVSSFIVQLSPNSSITLEWAKLEAGTVATLFVPRIYGEELLICRRYYRKYWTSMLFPQFYQNQYCGFMFDVPMRKDPTVKTFSILSTSNNSSIGQSVEVYAQGVYKFHVTSGYAEKAILVPMLELDAEIY